MRHVVTSDFIESTDASLDDPNGSETEEEAVMEEGLLNQLPLITQTCP